MRTRFFYLVLFAVSTLLGCTNLDEQTLEHAVSQNEKNINQLKEIAKEAGWAVSPKVIEGTRTTPLTEEELQDLQEELNFYLQIKETQEKRLIEVFPMRNRYIYTPLFIPKATTKSISGGSVLVYATYGYCPFGVCDKIPIKVCYDIDSNGNIVYAFGGTEHSINGAGPVSCSVCLGVTTYSSIYYKCEWGDTIYLKLWISFCKEYGWGSSIRGYLYSEGYVNIKTGKYDFETHEISKNELPPEIFTR